MGRNFGRGLCDCGSGYYAREAYARYGRGTYLPSVCDKCEGKKLRRAWWNSWWNPCRHCGKETLWLWDNLCIKCKRLYPIWAMEAETARDVLQRKLHNRNIVIAVLLWMLIMPVACFWELLAWLVDTTFFVWGFPADMMWRAIIWVARMIAGWGKFY